MMAGSFEYEKARDLLEKLIASGKPERTSKVKQLLEPLKDVIQQAIAEGHSPNAIKKQLDAADIKVSPEAIRRFAGTLKTTTPKPTKGKKAT